MSPRYLPSPRARTKATWGALGFVAGCVWATAWWWVIR
jgi:hypothetical protein